MNHLIAKNVLYEKATKDEVHGKPNFNVYQPTKIHGIKVS